MDTSYNLPVKSRNIEDMIRGLIFGQCIGDATGLAGEFMQSWQVSECYTFGNLSPLTRINDAHRNTWEPGDWTDDSDHMILVLQSLQSENPSEAFYDKLRHWYYHGFEELGDKAGYGIGNSIRMAVLDRYDTDLSISKSNGCIMRCAIVGALHTSTWELVKSVAIDVCKITHKHPKCITACVCIASLVWNMLKGIEDINTLIQIAYNQSVELLGKEKHIAEFKKILDIKTLDDFTLDPIHGCGYVYMPLMAAIYCIRNLNKGFKYLINEIIFKGGDTDTNCAVAGAIMGTYIGYDQLPLDWLDELANKAWLNEQFNSFHNQLM